MMKRVYGMMLALLLFTSATARAADTPDFSLTCKQGIAPFSVTFTSASGDPTEDDMTIRAVKNTTSLPLSVKPGWFHSNQQHSTIPTACSTNDNNGGSYPAFVRGSRLALFLTRDGRPGYDNLELVLIDLTAMKLLDVQTIGMMKTGFPVIQANGDGFNVRIVRDTNVAECDCADAYTDDWKQITFQADKIRTQWLRK